MRFVNKLCTLIFALLYLVGCSDDPSSTNETGVGGSTARYAIQDNYLYVVNDVDLNVYDIQDKNFEQLTELYVGFGVETIAVKPGFLYLGSREGMRIYSLQNPQQPEFIFHYDHIVSCDPVVVQGDRAYLTLSTGSTCGDRAINALEIIDISNPYEPELIKSYPMKSPRGVGVDGDLLFVAEGENGFKMFDISDELNLKLLITSNVTAFDVIARSSLLTVTGNTGITQYDYEGGDQPALSLLSTIPISK